MLPEVVDRSVAELGLRGLLGWTEGGCPGGRKVSQR